MDPDIYFIHSAHPNNFVYVINISDACPAIIPSSHYKHMCLTNKVNFYMFLQKVKAQGLNNQYVQYFYVKSLQILQIHSLHDDLYDQLTP